MRAMRGVSIGLVGSSGGPPFMFHLMVRCSSHHLRHPPRELQVVPLSTASSCITHAVGHIHNFLTIRWTGRARRRSSPAPRVEIFYRGVTWTGVLPLR